MAFWEFTVFLSLWELLGVLALWELSGFLALWELLGMISVGLSEFGFLEVRHFVCVLCMYILSKDRTGPVSIDKSCSCLNKNYLL